MANDLSGRPWVIDTASNTTVHPGNALVKAIAFTGYASASDTAVIKFADGTGVQKTLITLVGNASLTAVTPDFSWPIWVRDLAVTTLGSGQVSVFV